MDFSEKKVLRIAFSSFLAITTSACFSFGILAGIFGSIVAILGGSASFSFGETVLTGPSAAIPLLIFFPLAFGFLGFIGGLLSFLPFKLFLKIRKGLKLKLVIEE